MTYPEMEQVISAGVISTGLSRHMLLSSGLVLRVRQGIHLLSLAVRGRSELGLQEDLAKIAIPTREPVYASRSDKRSGARITARWKARPI